MVVEYTWLFILRQRSTEFQATKPLPLLKPSLLSTSLPFTSEFLFCLSILPFPFPFPQCICPPFSSLPPHVFSTTPCLHALALSLPFSPNTSFLIPYVLSTHLNLSQISFPGLAFPSYPVFARLSLSSSFSSYICPHTLSALLSQSFITIPLLSYYVIIYWAFRNASFYIVSSLYLSITFPFLPYDPLHPPCSPTAL